MHRIFRVCYPDGGQAMRRMVFLTVLVFFSEALWAQPSPE